MTKHVVARAADLKPGSRRLVQVAGKPIAIFNIGGEFFGLLNRCPHQGASLCHGLVTGLAIADAPGEFRLIRKGEMLKCPWHGWEFDIRTGQSWCDPGRFKVRNYPTELAEGEVVAKGPYVADTFPVTVEEQYVVVEV